MSYCHLVDPAKGGGVNFNKGFGPQPGNVLRARYAAATCLLTEDDGQPPPQDPCPGGTTVNGNLDSKGERVYLKVYQTSVNGVNQFNLLSLPIISLGLLKWNPTTQTWDSTATSSTSSLSYTGPPGWYAPYIECKSGVTPFSACLKTPATTSAGIKNFPPS